MNIVWTSCVIVSLVVLAVTNPQGVLPLCVQSSTTALQYAFELCAVYCVWLGVFEVANRCHVVEWLARRLRKVNGKLFGSISDKASQYASLNMASNLLGIGNAATPSGISAICEMERGTTLSRAGAMLFVLNASGLQLIPTTVIGLRASCGSANAGDIVLPTVISTALTTVIGVALVCIAYGRAK